MHHRGHRGRMRKRIALNGLDSLEDHEVLEYLLYFIHAQGDTNEIAHNILEAFHSIDKVFDADPMALMNVAGVGPATAQFLSTLPALFRRYERSRQTEGVRFVSLSRMVEWLASIYYGAKREMMVLLCLDADYNLIHDETWKEGTATEAAVSIRDLVAVCLKYDSAKVVFSHNHLTNINKPSQDDVTMTLELRNALCRVQIELLDHIIICPNGKHYSFNQEGRL